MLPKLYGTAYYCTLRILLLYATTNVCICASNDPYAALGINSLATTQEIRRAYKQMAKEWHPDKNQIPGAEEKFVEIKKSYELLSDSNRRRIYDRHGVIDEDSHYLQQKHDYSGYDRFASDQAEDIFGKHFIFDQDIVLYHKLSVTANYFEKTILLKSAKQLHIIMFYNDWCFQCTRLVGAFKKLIDVLEPLGIHFSTINAAHEPSVLRKTGSNEIPKMILVLDGKIFVYRDYSYTPQKVVEFIRKKLPYKIVQHVYDNNIDDFLGGWMDNRVRVLILEPRSLIRLRYLVTAFAFYDRVAFGFVDLTKKISENIINRFQVNASLDTLLIFNEDSTRSIARISLPDISTQILINMITPNQFLSLPRLSSQDMLESVCPAEWNRPRKRLCVILITENTDEHNVARGAMREIALHSRYSVERVRFAYMFKERQPNFINALSKGSFAKDHPQIVIIWRRDNTRMKYEWVFDAKQDATLVSTIPTESIINKTKAGLTHKIQKLLKASEALSYEAFVQKLLDEHSQGIFSKWITHFLYLVDYLSENVEDEHLFAAFSLLGTIGFMFGVGYILMYFVRAEEEHLKAQGHLADVTTRKPNHLTPELKLYELRAEKYNGMVRLLKPGCRTLLLITDVQSRKKLLPHFHKAVWPYRKTKTLLFGHMLIEKGLPWYTELLRLSLSSNEKLQVNPRNCVGTVIALNGHRKYFCMYHAKHPESVRGTKRLLKMTKQLLNINEDPEVGTFLGTSFSEESDAEIKVLLENNLLDSLDNWLERLFDGTTYKYYINYWPDFPTK
ncbi:dnaJ homolog subfamily C member 16 [Drosophila pseudoobscura]|uniref:DnaJ homolog subfamily C member 16 n=1 Tax=Drosophila pseudoobscura pseudoobscura TaxID=46245 RepID=A0A6I8VMF1_DROPS|nr:dnaJ homolog subfamily C member 16 [Drosophila pseudoobscura]XP_015044384.2 dnaJ homolog subfamily C member 16 [Drosophila pseudoobscura]XP_033238666.1 dnaJ homolog subfamily C member 16 [Drosophila pseudoobscura]